MLTVEELCAHLQKEKKVLQDIEKIKQYANEIKLIFQNILVESCPYRDPQLINYPQQEDFKQEISYDFNSLYIYCDFIRPEKHQYFVTYQREITQAIPKELLVVKKKKNINEILDGVSEQREQKFIPNVANVKMTTYHSFLSTAHLGEYLVHTKNVDENKNQRKFQKDKSVFKDWKTDNIQKIQQEFMEEIKYWNVSKFVKDEIELDQIIQYFKQNLIFFKNLFIIRSSFYSYPSLNMFTFPTFLQDINIYDKVFNQSVADRIFISVTKNLSEELWDIIPEKYMSRFQFYESLVRIANFKYKLQGITKSIYEGFQLLHQVLIEKSEGQFMWKPWRENILWCTDVNDLYKCNLKQMKLLFQKKSRKEIKNKLEDLQDIFQENFQINPDQVIMCWALSKMTIENDITQRQNYFELQFVEFLELFARLADTIFDQENMIIVEKIENLMDLTFKIIDQKRSIVKIDLQYDTESEIEFDQQIY